MMEENPSWSIFVYLSVGWRHFNSPGAAGGCLWAAGRLLSYDELYPFRICAHAVRACVRGALNYPTDSSHGQMARQCFWALCHRDVCRRSFAAPCANHKQSGGKVTSNCMCVYFSCGIERQKMLNLLKWCNPEVGPGLCNRVLNCWKVSSARRCVWESTRLHVTDCLRQKLVPVFFVGIC